MSTGSINNNALDALLTESAASIGPDGAPLAPSPPQVSLKNTFVEFGDAINETVDSFVPTGRGDRCCSSTS